MRIAYLHGFASGPGSTKGQYLASRLADAGIVLLLPDLTDGDFASMTISRELDVVGRLAEAVPTEPIVLIGSSLGGYIAALYAARNPARVERLVLMAPAFTFARSFPASLSTEVLASWRERGWMEVYHYGQEANCRLDIALLEDAAGYEDFPDVVVPTLIFHGRHDDVVDPALSETFAASRSNVELLLLDSNHELRDVTRTMWDRMRSFLNIP